MPFKSEKQRKYLFANVPELAKKWSNMYGKKIIGLGSLTKKEMMEIIKKGEISKLSQKDKKQLFEFAFGKNYMKSSDKGKKKKYKEIKRITGLGGVKSKKEKWPEQVFSYYPDEYKFVLEKVMSDRARYQVIDLATGKKELGGRVYGKPSDLIRSANDLIKPQGGTQSSNFGA